jgi:hypothetical protein
VSALARRLPTSRVTYQHSRSTRICISMAFSKGLSDRPDSGLLYRPQQSPREDAPYPTSTTTFPSPLSPLRNLSLAATAAEGRASLQRRFTTNALPTLSPIAQQRRQAADPAMTVSPFLIFFRQERGGSIYTQLQSCDDVYHAVATVSGRLAAAYEACDSMVKRIPLVKEHMLTDHFCCRHSTRLLP